MDGLHFSSPVRILFPVQACEKSDLTSCYHIVEVIKSMPQIESLGLLGSLGPQTRYTGLSTGDSGKLKVRLYSLNVTRVRYG
jgi:hypothetical protein